GVNWAAAFKVGGSIAGANMGALAVAWKLITGGLGLAPQTASAETTAEAKKLGLTKGQTQELAKQGKAMHDAGRQMGRNFVWSIIEGITSMVTGLGKAVQGLVADIVEAIHKHWPSWLPWPGGGGGKGG